MENASKALIMAAEILIGVMIISIGVYLFNVMGQYSSETTSQMEDTQIAQFNNQFLKYYGTITGDTGQIENIKVTIHDIVGLANLARQSNERYGFTEAEPISDSSYYIQIDLKIGHTTYRNLEMKTQDELVEIIKNNDIIINNNNSDNKTQTKYFYCNECTLGKNTKTVNYMNFVEF